MDFNTVRMDFPIDAIPFIGAWIGYNIGEIIQNEQFEGKGNRK